MSLAVVSEALEEEELAPPISRMVLVVAALLGILVAGYLTLHRYGFIGTLQCTVLGGCETVQASAYAYFPPRHLVSWGIPVALIGLLGYVVLFVIGLVGLQPGYIRSRWVARSLFVLSAGAFAFSLWLTWVEAAILEAWCQWCIISAVLIGVVFLLSIPGLRAAR